MAGVGSSAPLAVGSMDTSVSRSGHGGGTLSSNTGPFVLPSGGGSASTGVEFGNNGENTNGLQGLLGSGLSSETLLCRLKHNVCGTYATPERAVAVMSCCIPWHATGRLELSLSWLGAHRPSRNQRNLIS